MPLFIANAEVGDPTDSTSIVLLLFCAGLLCLVCLLSALPIVFARNRRHRQYDSVMAAVILWGLITAGVAIYALLGYMKWQKEYLLRIQYNYVNPQDTTGAPRQPWLIWAILAVAYIVIILWSRLRSPSPSDNPT